MKRWHVILWMLCLLLGLCGCGENAGSSLAVSEVPEVQAAEPVTAGDPGAYVIPQDWEQDSINDGTWGYVTEEAEFPVEGETSISGDCLITRTYGATENSLIRTELDGTERDRITIEFVDSEAFFDQGVGHYAYGQDCLWFTLDTYTMENEETEEIALSSELKKWDLDGNELLSISLEESLGMTKDDFVSALAVSPEGELIISTTAGTYFLNDDGSILQELEINTIWGLDFVTDTQGRTYGFDSLEGVLYTMDWVNHDIGEPVLTELYGTISSAGGAYDLLFCSEATLTGIDFETGTKTEILSWADWNLAGLVSSCAALDGETYLLTVHDPFAEGTELLMLRQVPMDEIPEKTVVTMAVPLNANVAEWGGTWEDQMDYYFRAQLASFNRKSAQYRVEVVTYSSAQELQLMIASGEAPDIIDWSYTQWLSDTPSVELYARKGYLVDLEPLFGDMIQDFIPSVVEQSKERTGSLYAMPLHFYIYTLLGRTEYVGSETGWTAGEMLEAARNMPEDMTLMAYCSQQDMLETLIQGLTDAFVDVQTGTCNFATQEFYDLLTLCRDYCPAGIGETYTEPSGGSLISGVGTLGRLGQFAAEELRNMEAQGKTVKGYPGIGGNGYQIVTTEEFSICSLGDQQQGAWEFLKTLYEYDFQYASGGMFLPVRQDAMNGREDWFVEINGMCTMEESLAARELVYGAEGMRNYSSPVPAMVLEEAEAFFAGDKTAQQVAEILNSRVKIYLSEQS